MVDLFRLLKKAFIANKQGFKEFGSEKKEEQLKKEPEIKEQPKGKPEVNPQIKKFFSMQQRVQQPRQSTGSPSRRFSLPSFNAPSLPSVPAGIAVYIGLIVISAIFLILKSFVGYAFGTSLVISIIQALFFFIAINVGEASVEKEVKQTLVVITFLLDTFLAQVLLATWPEGEWKNIFITIHVFAWLVLAAVLFLMGVFDTLGAGGKLGKSGWLVLLIILGAALFFLLPIIIQSPVDFQDETHAEYYGIAKAQVVKIAGTLEETKNFWYDYVSCSVGILGGDLKYDPCMDKKRIARYCKANVPVTEQQDCIKQQTELLEQGKRPGVAGSVSEAIKQVTKIELNVDDFFPKKTTDLRETYPVSLDIQNPREQVFTASVSCNFKKGKEELVGKTSFYGEEVNQIQIGGFSGEQQIPITCQPTTDLNGGYTLEYNVVLSGMQTFSFLKRAFISKEISAELRKQVEADNFKTSKEKASQGPAEFALLNFKFGTGVGTEPLILVEEPTTFSFAVEDVGSGAFKGEVLKVNSYNFHGLWERGFSIDSERIGDQDCLQGGEIKLLPAQTKKREPSELKRCFLTLPPDLQELQKNEYKVETFVADLNYDYKITKSIPIEVTPLETSVCGNSVLEAGEECDDGNQANTDACTSQCKNAVCGDKLVHEGVEQCDDGNTISGDGCSSCRLEAVS